MDGTNVMDFEGAWIALLLVIALVVLGGVAIVALRGRARRRGDERPARQPPRRSVPPAKTRRYQSDGMDMLAAIGGGFGGYFIAEAALLRFPHPLHWAVAAGSAALGFGGYWAWAFWQRHR